MLPDYTTIYRHALLVIAAPTPGLELEALLRLLNPDNLPPTELQDTTNGRWAEPWLLSGLSSSDRPSLGWSDRVIWSHGSDELRAGLLSLGLATAAWRGDLCWGPPAVAPRGAISVMLARIYVEERDPRIRMESAVTSGADSLRRRDQAITPSVPAGE